MAEDIKQTAKELTVALIPLCCKEDMDEETMRGFINRAIYLYKTLQKELTEPPKGNMRVTVIHQ